MEAAVTDRLAKIGVTVSTKAIESSGLAFRGIIIVDPGKISDLSNGMKGKTGNLIPLFCLIEIPFGRIA